MLFVSWPETKFAVKWACGPVQDFPVRQDEPLADREVCWHIVATSALTLLSIVAFFKVRCRKAKLASKLAVQFSLCIWLHAGCKQYSECIKAWRDIYWRMTAANFLYRQSQQRRSGQVYVVTRGAREE